MILTHFQKYQPKVGLLDKCYPIIVHGDALSVERHTGAQLARANGLSEEDRLANMVPNPQEFHKRMLFAQVEYINIILYVLYIYD